MVVDSGARSNLLGRAGLEPGAEVAAEELRSSLGALELVDERRHGRPGQPGAARQLGPADGRMAEERLDQPQPVGLTKTEGVRFSCHPRACPCVAPGCAEPGIRRDRGFAQNLSLGVAAVTGEFVVSHLRASFSGPGGQITVDSRLFRSKDACSKDACSTGSVRLAMGGRGITSRYAILRTGAWTRGRSAGSPAGCSSAVPATAIPMERSAP